MSAAPPPVKPAPYTEPAPQIGPDRNNTVQDEYAPMRGMPPITRTMSTVEANHKRQNYQPPNVIPGEFVFYRPAVGSGQGGDNVECCAFVIGTSNKTFNLKTFPNRAMHGEKSGVGYYDHTEPDPLATADPMAPWNNNGTFRRTQFGKIIAQILKTLDPAALIEMANFMHEQKNRMLELEDLVKPLIEERDRRAAEIERIKKSPQMRSATEDEPKPKVTVTDTKGSDPVAKVTETREGSANRKSS